jgi:uncharacterized protein YdaT
VPWTPKSFKSKHNKKLSPAKANKAAEIANDILRRTGDEARAIRGANSVVKPKKRKKGKK